MFPLRSVRSSPVDVKVAHRAAFVEDDLRRTGVAEGRLLQIGHIDRLSVDGADDTVGEPDDLVAVHRVGHARVPCEVTPRIMVVQQHFETRIADLTSLHEYRRITRRGRRGRFEGLVEGIRAVPCSVEVELAAEETGIETYFPRFGLLRLEVLVGEAVKRVPFVRLSLVIIVGFGQVGRIGRAYGRIGTAHLEEGEPFRHIDHLGNDGRKSLTEGRRTTCISRRREPIPSRCGR